MFTVRTTEGAWQNMSSSKPPARSFSDEVEDRYKARKAKRIDPRLRLNWVSPTNTLRLGSYFPMLERMFLRGKDYMDKELWEEGFIDLHRCVTYIFELRKVHRAWTHKQYRKETTRMIQVLATKSIQLCEKCRDQMKLEIQMSIEAEAARAAQVEATLKQAKMDEAARQAALTAEIMREEERRAREAGDTGRASIAAEEAEAAEAHVIGVDQVDPASGDGSVPIYVPGGAPSITAKEPRSVLKVGDVATYKTNGVTIGGAKIIAVHQDGGGGEPYYTICLEAAGGKEKQTTRDHLSVESDEAIPSTNNSAAPPPAYSASIAHSRVVQPPPAPSVPVAPVMPSGPLYGNVPAPTQVPQRNLSTVQAQRPKPPQVNDRVGQWAVNSKCDILDRFISRYTKRQVEQWRRGQVIAVSGQKVLVTFYNWSHEHDVWINLRTEPGRLARYGSKTAAVERAWSGITLTFREKMQRRGLSVVTMRGDGNCLFRAVAHQIWGDPELHAMVRTMVCDFMLANRGEFAEVLGALVPGRNGFERYVAQMRRPCFQGQGEWGGDPEIRVMEEIFDRPFELWDVERGADAPANIHLKGSLPEDHKVAPIRVSYHGKNHYNSVKPLNGKFPLGELRTSNIRNFRKRTAKGAREFDSGYK